MSLDPSYIFSGEATRKASVWLKGWSKLNSVSEDDQLRFYRDLAAQALLQTLYTKFITEYAEEDPEQVRQLKEGTVEDRDDFFTQDDIRGRRHRDTFWALAFIAFGQEPMTWRVPIYKGSLEMPEQERKYP